MFGYVMVNRSQLKMGDYEIYRSYYCGLCRELRSRYGIWGQASLTYDLTFLVILLNGLYEPKVRRGKTRCIVHPLITSPVRKTVFSEYAADMNVLLAYYKCLDDWKDEKNAVKFAYSGILKGSVEGMSIGYADKIQVIKDILDELTALEKKQDTTLDEAAGCSGKLLAEIFAPRHDRWEPSLRRMGFYLGKFIYLADAYEDVEQDAKSGCFNPFLKAYPKEGPLDGFETQVRQLLVMMLSDACREFESLPILRHEEILRNVLYSGIWQRFDLVSTRRAKEREKRNA